MWQQTVYEDGDVWTSDGRCAMAHYMGAGKTEVTLTDPVNKMEYIGTMSQFENALDVCRIWVEEGRQTEGFSADITLLRMGALNDAPLCWPGDFTYRGFAQGLDHG